MNQVCRCCLVENPSVAFNIFHENLRAELLLCVPSVNIEPDDGLPELICDHCWLRLREAVDFRRCCEDNDRELRKRYDETSQAIEEALGLGILEQIGGSCDAQPMTNVMRGEPGLLVEDGVDGSGAEMASTADMSVGQLFEEYSNFGATMLDELMLDDNSFGSLPDIDHRPCATRKGEEDPIFSELFAKFLNGTAIDSAAESANSVSPTNHLTKNDCLHNIPPPNTSDRSDPMACATQHVPNAAPTPPAAKKSKSSSPKPLRPCPQCDKKFTRNFQLKLHLISVHGVGDGPQYTCAECSKTFASRHSLSYHQKALHSMERPFLCPHCGRSFVLRTQLASHLRTHRGEAKPRIYPCTQCEKSWPTKSDLKTHMRSHDPHLERPFKCTRCPKSFFTQGHLNSHELVHTGEKPYRCGLCEKGYQNVGNLNNHIYRSHSDVILSGRLTQLPPAASEMQPIS